MTVLEKFICFPSSFLKKVISQCFHLEIIIIFSHHFPLVLSHACVFYALMLMSLEMKASCHIQFSFKRVTMNK